MSPGTLGGSLAAASLAFLAVGWYEELISRGYWLVNLSEGFELRRLGLHGRTSLLVAVLLSSSVFALGHARNPNATVVSTVALVAAGLLLAVPVVRTGQLWMSIGLHFGWNLFEGPVFGFPVSGIPTFQLVRPVVTGPTLWTGGAFGPEAGLLLLVLQVLAAILIWLVTRGRNARPA
jgi:membrane protease YdiL (CAAX protease family)